MAGFSPFHKAPLLPVEDNEQVVAAIRAAEAKTTGEIRVYIESRCKYVDAMIRARELFTQLGMHKTERRNAVILYLAIKDRQFAIFGDQEIYEKAGGPAFWQQSADDLKIALQQGAIPQGIVACVQSLGNALAHHFPFDPSITKNELPDDIVFGK
jgi:uncharacterized membrane protein